MEQLGIFSGGAALNGALMMASGGIGLAAATDARSNPVLIKAICSGMDGTPASAKTVEKNQSLILATQVMNVLTLAGGMTLFLSGMNKVNGRYGIIRSRAIPTRETQELERETLATSTVGSVVMVTSGALHLAMYDKLKDFFKAVSAKQQADAGTGGDDDHKSSTDHNAPFYTMQRDLYYTQWAFVGLGGLSALVGGGGILNTMRPREQFA